MAHRRQILDALINDCEMNPKNILESLVAAMSDREFNDLIEYIQRIEDWKYKVQGTKIVDSETDKVFFESED